jgi:hypothetical protein
MKRRKRGASGRSRAKQKNVERERNIMRLI